jgi:very-short-patch-repair endonuclease
LSERALSRSEVAEFVLGARKGAVLALGGIDNESLRILLDEVEPHQSTLRVLFARIAPVPTTEAIIDQVIDLLAKIALRLWPVWFADISFEGCRNDPLGRLAVGVTARRAGMEIAGLSPSWVEAAARLALDGRSPRVRGTPAPVEIAHLARAVSRSCLIMVLDIAAAAPGGLNSAALVHALEWIAQHSGGAAIALFPELPANAPPFDRILFGARNVVADVDKEFGSIEPDSADAADETAWIVPWRGLPHPLSPVEQRLAKALEADAELAPLFHFNTAIDTLRGSRPRVDLVWVAGKLVVEIDGYESHGNRTAFLNDRHRDYELMLSGFTVLRLANDEITQDVEKAIEKIRDLVKLCRTRTTPEG